MKAFIVAIVLIFNIINIVSGQTDYCSLCPNHIACNNPGTLSPNCPSDAFVSALTHAEINVLLNEHNDFRNRLAGGSIPGFSTASKMMKVGWDYELAYFAELNVKQCQMKHDGCRATKQFPYAGQNLYWGAQSGTWGNMSVSLRNSVVAWSNEYKDANQSHITTCCGGDWFYKIGHFLQVAQDQAVAIGCAASRYTDGGWKATLIACNYSYGNMIGRPVYTVGSPGSACPAGRDTIFTNLCK